MVTSKYQRFHDILIEFPMVRKRRLANILSNPNDYCCKIFVSIYFREN